MKLPLQNPPAGFAPRQGSPWGPGHSPKICSLHVQSQTPPGVSSNELPASLKSQPWVPQPAWEEPLPKTNRVSLSSLTHLYLFLKAQACCKTNPSASDVKETNLGDNLGQTPGPDTFWCRNVCGHRPVCPRAGGGLTYGRPCRTRAGSASRRCCSRQIGGGRPVSNLGCPAPSPAPLARAASEKGNRSEFRAAGFAGTRFRPSGAVVTSLGGGG